jgi:ribosome-associated protein
MSRKTVSRKTVEEEWEALDGRPSKTEQKKAVQRFAALGEQLAALSPNQIKKLPIDEILKDALLQLGQITAFEARRRQFQRIGKLLRNEDESVLMSALSPRQGAKKQAQLMRWIDRLLEQGDQAINDFVRQYHAAERHTLRQHILRLQRDLAQNSDESIQQQSRQKLVNYVQQVALLSDEGK